LLRPEGGTVAITVAVRDVAVPDRRKPIYRKFMESSYRTCCWYTQWQPTRLRIPAVQMELRVQQLSSELSLRRRATKFCTAMMQASGQFVPLSARWRNISVLRSARRNALSRETCPSVAAKTIMNVDIQTAHVDEGHTKGVLSYPRSPGEPSNAPKLFRALCKVLIIDLDAEMHLLARRGRPNSS
jgi:hypothetical protein